MKFKENRAINTKLTNRKKILSNRENIKNFVKKLIASWSGEFNVTSIVNWKGGTIIDADTIWAIVWSKFKGEFGKV